MNERMDIDGWRYYNHAAVPTVAPHEKVDTKPVEDGSIWKIKGGKSLLARWTEDYDCDEKTEFWYCVLDKPFNIDELKSNRRYKINKGNRLFDVRDIDPSKFLDELLDIQKAAYSAYPEKYRPTVDEEVFRKSMSSWNKDGKSLFYGAFFRETNELCGYHIVGLGDRYRWCNVLKTKPDFEKYQINAALVYKWVTDSEELIRSGGYIFNGTRTINHETAFQDYLEYYFGFRKAYCRLRIVYRPLLRIPVKILYLCRRFLVRFDSIGKLHEINSVLKMEEIARRC